MLKTSPLQCNLFIRRNRRGPYYKCIVFHDPECLRLFAREQDKVMKVKSRSGEWDKCLGAARNFGRGSLKRRPNQVGVVLLSREHLGVGIVSHEMTHAALYQTRRTDFPLKITKRDDEKLAWAVGWLCTQFYDWFYRQKGAPKSP